MSARASSSRRGLLYPRGVQKTSSFSVFTELKTTLVQKFEMYWNLWIFESEEWEKAVSFLFISFSSLSRAFVIKM